MIVKVCGLNTAENCLAIDALDPTLLGMIFYEKSPRYIAKKSLPETKADKVGVFVNAELADILSAVEKHRLRYVQLHGHESLALAKSLKQKEVKMIKCFSIDQELNMDEMREWQPYCDYFLFDTKGKYLGGNGVKFNWRLLHDYKLDTPFLLSGGISLTDVKELKKISNPAFAGVDINSRFELEPGIKNVEQVKSFIDGINR